MKGGGAALTVGMFDSVYTDVTFSILSELINHDMNFIALNPAANTLNEPGERADILIINAKPETPSAFICEAAVVDTDNKDILKFLTKYNARVVSYGFNHKASVTASSIHDDKVVFCVQRAFQTLSGAEVYQREFSVCTGFYTINKIGDKNISYSQYVTNCLLPAVTTALTAGVPAEDLTRL